jgi:hypothetical protein
MQSGVHIRKTVKTECPDIVEEKANSYEHPAYYVQCSH